jgi:murein L,D-transpeptidase YcbB/YkuD
MTRKDRSVPVIFLFLFCLLTACNNSKRPPVSDIASNPEEIDKKVTDIIRSSIEFAEENNGVIDSSVGMAYPSVVKLIYQKRQFAAFWSEKENWKPLGDSLLYFIENAKLYGLFPEDYHFLALDSIRQKISADSTARSDRRDALVWANADLLMTDAFIHIVKDLKLGRLPADSITLRQDSVLTDESYFNRLALVQLRNSLAQVFHTLEPEHEGYVKLKAALPSFLKNATYKDFIPVPSPKQNNPDFKKRLQARLYEGGFLSQDSIPVDSTMLSEAIKTFQQSNGITVDGKAGEETVRLMNITDRERFIRIAITMDRYKLLPEKMPPRYVWVNLPAYYMEFRENDTLKLVSKIICGKPATRTPLLTSAISELITYPQWTIPTSIIVKEILPAIKKNTGYLAEKGYSLINSKGDEVHPDSVDWSKYSKGIPYKVVQGSGDANALGILKFNFPNKYAVYLHDTNQRYLFAKEKRSLSHGCVRVQDWEKLAYSIVQYDNKERLKQPSPAEDSMTTWLKRKEKHSIAVRNRLPVYIRYFTCQGGNGKILFYDDIYGEDKILQQKYFARY